MGASTFELSVDGVEIDFATITSLSMEKLRTNESKLDGSDDCELFRQRNAIDGTLWVGHILLTQLLLDKLKATASETGIEGRIVSSNGHELFVYKEGIKFDEIYNPDKTNVKKGSVMDCLKNYGQSKLAQILYTKELAKRLQDEGVNNVTVNSLHPGTVRTNITANAGTWIKPLIDLALWITAATPSQGAGLQTYLAISPDVKGVTGKYFDNYKEYPLKEKHDIDEELQKKLWDFSMKIISS